MKRGKQEGSESERRGWATGVGQLQRGAEAGPRRTGAKPDSGLNRERQTPQADNNRNYLPRGAPGRCYCSALFFFSSSFFFLLYCTVFGVRLCVSGLFACAVSALGYCLCRCCRRKVSL
jgi:hypothetical protein